MVGKKSKSKSKSTSKTLKRQEAIRKNALDKGLIANEDDLKLTKDGKAIVFTDRATTYNKEISDSFVEKDESGVKYQSTLIVAKDLDAERQVIVKKDQKVSGYLPQSALITVDKHQDVDFDVMQEFSEKGKLLGSTTIVREEIDLDNDDVDRMNQGQLRALVKKKGWRYEKAYLNKYTQLSVKQLRIQIKKALDEDLNVVEKALDVDLNDDGIIADESKLISHKEFELKTMKDDLENYELKKLTYSLFNSERMSKYMKEAKESGSTNSHSVAIKRIGAEWQEYKKEWQLGFDSRIQAIKEAKKILKDSKAKIKSSDDKPLKNYLKDETTAIVKYNGQEVIQMRNLNEYWSSPIKKGKYVQNKFNGQTFNMQLADGSWVYYLIFDRIAPSVMMSNGGFGTVDSFEEKEFVSDKHRTDFINKLELKYDVSFDITAKDWKEFTVSEDESAITIEERK